LLIFGLNKKNIDGYCISIWNAWRMGMACHWTFSEQKKIPEIARGLGKGIREFKDATKDIKQEIEQGAQSDEKKP
jgi:hypothetical protein